MRGQEIVRGLASLTLILLLIWVVHETPMNLLRGLPEQAEMSTFSEATLKTASYLWDERLLDIISQALVVFSAIICALTLFREEKK